MIDKSPRGSTQLAPLQHAVGGKPSAFADPTRKFDLMPMAQRAESGLISDGLWVLSSPNYPPAVAAQVIHSPAASEFIPERYVHVLNMSARALCVMHGHFDLYTRYFRLKDTFLGDSVALRLDGLHGTSC